MDDVFGQDIKLGPDGQALVAANGELILTAGVDTGVQDIRLRLGTPLGELFYDTEWGSLIHQWFLDENTTANQAGFEAEVERRIEEDPRVEIGTAACSVIAWDETGFSARVEWEFITEDLPYNLVITYDSEKKELLIGDINPRTSL